MKHSSWSTSILRAEAIWKFQLPLPPPRPWWKLWGKDPELPAIVG